MRITIHRVRLGPDEFRIVRAAAPFARARLIDHGRWGLQMNVDAGAARDIGMLWLLAARSRRSLVYLPLRGGAHPAAGPQTGETDLDLVLLHHSLRFKPHQWKRVRGRLARGATSTVDLSRDDLPGDEAIDYAVRSHRENRDRFLQRIHAETLFMVGSAKVYRATARMFFDIVEHGPVHRRFAPWDLHYCTELTGEGVLGDAREIHIEYTPRWVG
jgi:hypothetical protein